MRSSLSSRSSRMMRKILRSERQEPRCERGVVAQDSSSSASESESKGSTLTKSSANQLLKYASAMLRWSSTHAPVS